MAFSVGADEKLAAKAVRMLPTGLVIWDGVGEKATLGLKR
jgi:hypothetical protein